LNSNKKFKISGSGSSPFRELYKIVKNKTSGNKKKNKKLLKLETVDFTNFDPMRDFTKWEKIILDKIKKMELKIEFKHRKFPLQVNSKIFLYIPDVMIFGFRINNKKIIVEAHQDLLEEDIIKYRKFIKEYKNIYHVIMIVEGSQLRKWNEKSKGAPLFSEIWVKEDIKDFINYLNKEKTKFEKKFHNFPQEAFCARKGCGEEAKGYDEIERLFGYRKIKDQKIIVQSYCRYCRTIKHKI